MFPFLMLIKLHLIELCKQRQLVTQRYCSLCYGQTDRHQKLIHTHRHNTKPCVGSDCIAPKILHLLCSKTHPTPCTASLPASVREIKINSSASVCSNISDAAHSSPRTHPPLPSILMKLWFGGLLISLAPIRMSSCYRIEELLEAGPRVRNQLAACNFGTARNFWSVLRGTADYKIQEG